MAKGKSANNRETRKPKKEKVKVLATANSNAANDGIRIGGKTAK